METLLRNNHQTNLGSLERWASMLGGAALVVGGMRKRSVGGAVLAALGADLLYRGTTGHCHLYQALGLSSFGKTGKATIPYRQGIRVDESITIDKTPEELYGFWRRFDNLPYFMEHLLSVSLIDERRSHWTAKGPAGKNVQWEAEITLDIPNQAIGWRSLEGSDVLTAGSVHFRRAPHGRGTEVKVELQYMPPGGVFGALYAKLFGEEPEHQVREDLRHLKQMMEAGEVASVKGQPRGPDKIESSPRFENQRHMKSSNAVNEVLPSEDVAQPALHEEKAPPAGPLSHGVSA